MYLREKVWLGPSLSWHGCHLAILPMDVLLAIRRNRLQKQWNSSGKNSRVGAIYENFFAECPKVQQIRTSYRLPAGSRTTNLSKMTAFFFYSLRRDSLVKFLKVDKWGIPRVVRKKYDGSISVWWSAFVRSMNLMTLAENSWKRCNFCSIQK